MSTSDDWVQVASFSARYLAEIPLQTLEGAGIPMRTEGEETGIWGPGFAGAGTRGFQIWVRAQDLEDARALLGLDADDPPDPA